MFKTEERGEKISDRAGIRTA